MALTDDPVLPFYYDKINHRLGLGTDAPQGIMHTVSETDTTLKGVCENIGNTTAVSGDCYRDEDYPVIHRADNLYMGAGAQFDLIQPINDEYTAFIGTLTIAAASQSSQLICAHVLIAYDDLNGQYVVINTTGTEVSTADSANKITIIVSQAGVGQSPSIAIKNNFAAAVRLMYTLDFAQIIPLPPEPTME